jgi:hypothetical protein
VSKADLKKYLKGLSKAQLQEQLEDLYDRFKPVKVYYDFAFNPNEERLVEEAKFKIGKEYFPQGKRKPKLRRSVAQKLIKHFETLGMAPSLLLDVMLFNIEIAQAYTFDKPIKQEAFYKSMLLSFNKALIFAENSGLFSIYEERIRGIVQKAEELNWQNSIALVDAYENALMNLDQLKTIE